MARAVSWIAVAIWSFSSIAHAGDVDQVVSHAYSVLTKLSHGRTVTVVTFERRPYGWVVGGLDITFDELSDLDLAHVAGFAAIDRLELGFDQIRSTDGLQKLTNMHGLRHLSLPWTVGNGELATVASLPALEELEFQEAGYMTERFPNRAFLELVKSRKLRRLVLPSGNLEDSSLEFIGALVRLEELDLHHNGSITDNGIKKLKGLVNLRSLRVDRLGAKAVATLKDFPHLEYISKVILPSAAGSGKSRLLTSTQEDQGWLNDVVGVGAGEWRWA